MIKSEIIAIGNEILIGDVLDTNTNWLCQQITGMGGRVQRAVIVGDELEAIAREIQGALNRQAGVIFTTGGLGPTADDMTLTAVAQVTGHPLERNDKARTFVQEKYRQLAQKGHVDDPALTPAREKMARLPAGATPLNNPTGAAPAAALKLEETTLISLPGVPAELKGIFHGSLQPILEEIFGKGHFLEKVAIVNSKDESVLAPILKSVADENPTVYVKSRAKKFGPDVKFRVTLSASGRSRPTIEEQLHQALQDLKQALNSAGISIESVQDNSQ